MKMSQNLTPFFRKKIIAKYAPFVGQFWSDQVMLLTVSNFSDPWCTLAYSLQYTVDTTKLIYIVHWFTVYSVQWTPQYWCIVYTGFKYRSILSIQCTVDTPFFAYRVHWYSIETELVLLLLSVQFMLNP